MLNVFRTVQGLFRQTGKCPQPSVFITFQAPQNDADYVVVRQFSLQQALSLYTIMAQLTVAVIGPYLAEHSSVHLFGVIPGQRP